MRIYSPPGDFYFTVAKVARTRLFLPLLFGGTLLFLVVSFFIFLFSLPPHKAVAQDVGKSVPAAAAGAPLFFLEMHIANNGLTLLRSARVVAVSKSTLTVRTAWGSTNFTWTILVKTSRYGTHNFGTRFLNQDGQELSPQEVHIGSVVTITGMLDTSAREPTLQADTIRRLDE